MPNFIALVVEDDTFQREILAEFLRDHGLEVVECSSAETAELVLASTGTELVALVTDVNLGSGMSGVELAQYAKRTFPHVNVVMISGNRPPTFPGHSLFHEALQLERTCSSWRQRCLEGSTSLLRKQLNAGGAAPSGIKFSL